MVKSWWEVMGGMCHDVPKFIEDLNCQWKLKPQKMISVGFALFKLFETLCVSLVRRVLLDEPTQILQAAAWQVQIIWRLHRNVGYLGLFGHFKHEKQC